MIERKAVMQSETSQAAGFVTPCADVRDREVQVDPMAEQCANPEAEPRRVLVVDDALTVRLYYREILEQAGFDVREASNGVEGLERSAEVVPDLMLVDVNMPKMDGYALLRALRSAEATRAIPVIMISTEAQTHDADLGHEAGANMYFVKPVRPAELAAYARLLSGAPSL